MHFQAPTAGSGSPNPEPTEGTHVEEASGSQLPVPTLSPEPPLGPTDHEAPGSWILKATSGPDSQHATGTQLLEVPSGLGDQEPSAPGPMEINPSDPPWRVRTIQ
jgi:hypothetical protein